MSRKYILDKETVNMKLQRMAFEVIENNLDEKNIILVGIRENGGIIARNIADILKASGELDVTLIELSLDKKRPGPITLSVQPDFSNKVILLIDDVANSGKTMLYSLKPFLDFHPRKIQTLALVERSHKAFPINLDYVGLSVATTLQEHIFVDVSGQEVIGAYME